MEIRGLNKPFDPASCNSEDKENKAALSSQSSNANITGQFSSRLESIFLVSDWTSLGPCRLIMGTWSEPGPQVTSLSSTPTRLSSSVSKTKFRTSEP